MTQIKRYFWQDHKVGSAPGTYFKHWGGWISADHVYKAQGYNVPSFAKGRVRRSDGLVDTLLIGGKLPKQRPPDPYEGQMVMIGGYPRGSNVISWRMGKVYMRRGSNASEDYITPSWIITFVEDWAFVPDIMGEPVTTGMSGSPVVDMETKEPIGVLITEGHGADLDDDGRGENTCDFQALSDAWDALQDVPLA